MKYKYTKEECDIAYRNGNPLISDAEYDSIFGENASDMDSPLEKSHWKKFNHPTPMSSLTKIKIYEDGVDNWDNFDKWKDEKNKFIVTWKYDGLAIGLYYEDGILKNAVTRGSGLKGDDITRNVLKMQNVKKQLPESYTGFIKAEIVMKKSDYKNYLEVTDDKTPYKNVRNGCSGAAKSLDGKNCKYLYLMYYDIESSEDFEEDKFIKLSKLFNINNPVLCTYEELKKLYYQYEIKRPNLDFDVDGIVVVINSVNEQKKLGIDPSNRPKWKIALKFDNMKAESVLNDIIWQTGKSGQVTPVGIIEPIFLGVTVSRASLANADMIRSKKILIGDRVVVSRRNDVIPMIEESLEDHDGDDYSFEDLKNCPVCNKELIRDTLADGDEGTILLCINFNCPALVAGNMEKWIDEIKKHFIVKDIGPESIAKLIESDLVKDISDLYRITPKEVLERVDRTGESSVKNMLGFQEFKKLPLVLFLGALNIRKVGKGVWKYAIDAGFNTLDKLMNSSVAELSAIDNIGDQRAELMIKGLLERKKLIDRLFEVGITIEEVKDKSGSLLGKKICLTGTISMKRDHMAKIIEDNGGEFSKSFKKSLDIMIVGENAGSKVAKAEAAGIKIMSEQEFMDLI